MKPLADFEAVLFDLDGVITNTAQYHYQGWKRLADELGVPFNEKQNENLKGVDRMASLDYILNLGGIEKTLEERQALAKTKNDFYQQLIADVSEEDLLPGSLELLERLKSKGVRLGLASASQNAPALIEGLGLTALFDHIADARIARSKPAPDIFLFAAYGVGVHPRQCVGLEDSIAGLQSIKRCHMYAVSVGEYELSQHSDAHVRSLSASMA